MDYRHTQYKRTSITTESATPKKGATAAASRGGRRRAFVARVCSLVLRNFVPGDHTNNAQRHLAKHHHRGHSTCAIALSSRVLFLQEATRSPVSLLLMSRARLSCPCACAPCTCALTSNTPPRVTSVCAPASPQRPRNTRLTRTGERLPHTPPRMLRKKTG